MKASHLRGLVPCVCLCLLMLFPATAEPTPHALTINIFAASAPSIEVLAIPAEPVAPPTVHVVLFRGAQRLEIDLPLDGRVSAELADAIARIMADPKTGRTRRIHRGTLALLADVAARYPGHEIEIISAVRSEPDRTRQGVPHSRHWDGRAIDLRVHGAKLADVRDAMWKGHRHIGVGWYPGAGFIHLDYRPDVGDIAWTQPRPNANNIYHPRWSRVSRDL
ncbi:MAG: DUF882 domain-containing protein [Myxococcales bacterium]|nr:DUF882 domain-containing protein [Myxococcales bacterium]